MESREYFPRLHFYFLNHLPAISIWMPPEDSIHHLAEIHCLSAGPRVSRHTVPWFRRWRR